MTTKTQTEQAAEYVQAVLENAEHDPKARVQAIIDCAAANLYDDALTDNDRAVNSLAASMLSGDQPTAYITNAAGTDLERVDLTTLTTARLQALHNEAGVHGDEAMCATITTILYDRNPAALYDADSGNLLGPATAEQHAASDLAAATRHPNGIILIDDDGDVIAEGAWHRGELRRVYTVPA